MEMSYCSEKAIPHSQFLEWDPEDRAKVLAYIAEDAERCQMCGTAGWEWEENRFAYTAVDEFCQGCYAKSMYSDTESRALPGTQVKLVPTTPLIKAKMQVTAMKRRSMARE